MYTINLKDKFNYRYQYRPILTCEAFRIEGPWIHYGKAGELSNCIASSEVQSITLKVPAQRVNVQFDVSTVEEASNRLTEHLAKIDLERADKVQREKLKSLRSEVFIWRATVIAVVTIKILFLLLNIKS